ncbi:SEC-C domain-containing protein, partial [Candidatus Bipolaricaulota bacterium]|nr:SEC-C domain-containing protein [Candidatus Bipolaricaulota bacterium]
GTDIKLGDGVAELGGLHVVGCQRHESRRIDNQLLGRAGRQGDPGSSQFYLAMEDDLLRIFGGERLGAIMDRVGMEEGEAIEHNLLTSAIRRAQKRVEGRNFEIRKRLLEYDLVLSKQREAIYALRDRFLLPPPDAQHSLTAEDEADLDDYLHDLFDERAGNLLALYAGPKTAPDEWNLEGLTHELSAIAPTKAGEFADASGAPDLSERVNEHMRRALEAQKKRIGAQFQLLARYLILMTIDEAWRTHLYTLDDLKGGIGWTAYGGGDPLVAFKRESFVLFQEMLGRAAEKIVRTILNPRLEPPSGTRQPRTAPDVRYVHPSVTSSAPAASLKNPAGKPMPGRSSATALKEPGRNDPCPCGSGKKYKKCHGRGA